MAANGMMVTVEVEFRNREIPADSFSSAKVDVGPGLFIITGEQNVLAVYPIEVVHRIHYPDGVSRIAQVSL
jgi:hypothetical protein